MRLIVLCGVLLAVSARAAVARELALGPIQTIDQTDGFEPNFLRSADGVVVWQHQLTSESFRIRAWDVPGGVRTVRATSSSQQAVVAPDVSGRTVVWSEAVSFGNSAKIRAANLDDLSITDVSDGLAGEGDPSIEGSLVVWSQRGPNDLNDIYHRDLQGPSGAQPISNDPAVFEGAPDISNRRVIYTHNGPTRRAVRVFDLAFNSVTFEQVMPANTTAFTRPRPMIDDNIAGWFENAGQGPTGLRVIDLDSGQDWLINNTQYAAVSDGVVVYNDFAQQKIFAFNTLDGSTTLLRTFPFGGGTTALTLDGFRMTWVEWTGVSNRYEIKTAFIPEPSAASLLGLALITCRRRGAGR